MRQSRAVIILVFHCTPVLRFLYDLPPSITHELRHAVSVVRFGEPSYLIVLPSLPATIGVLVIGKSPSQVMLMVHSRTIRQLCRDHRAVKVTDIVALHSVKAPFTNHLTIKVTFKEVTFTMFVLDKLQLVIGIILIVQRTDHAHTARPSCLTSQVTHRSVFHCPQLVATGNFNRQVVGIVGDAHHALSRSCVASNTAKSVTLPFCTIPIRMPVFQSRAEPLCTHEFYVLFDSKKDIHVISCLFYSR